MEIASKEVLLTGATGFLGGHLLLHLVHEGYHVKVLCRRATFDIPSYQYLDIPNEKLKNNIQVCTGDLLHFDSLKKAVQGVDVVIHLAAEMDFFPKDPSKVYQVNVEGTRNLLNACIESKIKKFIYSSSTEAIGPVKGNKPGDENCEFNPNHDYGKSKVMVEQLIHEFCAKNSLEYLILRPSGIYGPGDSFVIYELMQMINQGMLFFIVGRGNHKVTFIHVEDVATAFLLALKKGKPNSVYIICPDQPSTFKEMQVNIAKALHRVPPWIHLPYVIVRPTISLLKPFGNLFKRRTFMYQEESVDRMFEDRWYSNEKAKRELGWKLKYNYEEGFKHVADYYFKQELLTRTYFSPISIILFVLVITFALLTCRVLYFS